MSREAEPDFQGKVLAVTMGAGGEGLILQSPRFEWQAGRQFLVGDIPKQLDDWTSGRSGAVAWDAVIDYLVFDSVEQYMKHASRHRPSLRERLWR
jgi:hypothetical protein